MTSFSKHYDKIKNAKQLVKSLAGTRQLLSDKCGVIEDYTKMADKEWCDFYVVFTVSLCAL